MSTGLRTPACARLALARLAAAFVLCWTGIPGSALAATITVNFDVDPDGDPIANGAVVDSTYQRFGISLTCVDVSGGCTGTDVYANDGDDFASSPNVVTTQPSGFPSFNNSDAWIEGSLERAAIEVCIAVNPETSGDRGKLAIVDNLGNELDSVVSATGVTGPICVQAAAIQFFRFAGDGKFASFDDLRITYGPNRVDFDTTADGSAVPDGAPVDDLFVSEGVTFERVGSGACGQDFVFANDDLPGSFGSPPNAVSVCNGSNFSDFSENQNGRVRAFFARRVNQVCIDALPSSGSDQAVLRGFDKDGQQIVQTNSAAGNFEQRICVSDSQLRSVEFGGLGNDFARFDNLDFDFGAASIDFDVDTADQPIPGDSVINDTYVSASVLFEGERVGMSCGVGDEVYANDDVTGDFASSPNQVSICNTNFSDFSENAQGMVHASFGFDALSVCIDVRATKAADYAVMRSYDASDVEISQVSSQAGATETLCITGDGIRGVRFAGAGGRFARFDNLDVTFSPEPGSALLGLSSLLVLAGLARRVRPRG